MESNPYPHLHAVIKNHDDMADLYDLLKDRVNKNIPISQNGMLDAFFIAVMYFHQITIVELITNKPPDVLEGAWFLPNCIAWLSECDEYLANMFIESKKSDGAETKE